MNPTLPFRTSWLKWRKGLSSNTAPSKAIGSGVIAVAEGVGTAVGETAGKWYGDVVEQVKEGINEGLDKR